MSRLSNTLVLVLWDHQQDQFIYTVSGVLTYRNCEIKGICFGDWRKDMRKGHGQRVWSCKVHEALLIPPLGAETASLLTAFWKASAFFCGLIHQKKYACSIFKSFILHQREVNLPTQDGNEYIWEGDLRWDSLRCPTNYWRNRLSETLLLIKKISSWHKATAFNWYFLKRNWKDKNRFQISKDVL